MRTVLLEHVVRSGRHYDWLLEDPEDPSGPLVAFRVGVAWRDWCRVGRVKLMPLPPHRRRYLRYQGPLSDGRGDVRRVGRGVARVRRWCPRGAVIGIVPHTPDRRLLGVFGFHAVSDVRWIGSSFDRDPV